MKCDIKIMGSPKRIDNIVGLCVNLGLSLNKDVFIDDRPNPKGAMYTARKTWNKEFADDITHRCVLQDDVSVSQGFYETIQRFVNLYPDAIFTLFCSRKVLKEYDAPSIVKVNGCGVWGQGVIVPKKHIKKIFEWVDGINPNYPHDDTAIGEYAREHGVNVYTTVPNIVQHEAPTNSLLGYNNKRKVSSCFVKEDVAVFDWENAKLNSIYAGNSVKVR